MSHLHVRACVAAIAVLTAAACRNAPDPRTPSGQANEIVVALRTEPESFNFYKARNSAARLVSLLTQAKLARVNPVTQEVEPWLAEGWTRSTDGRQFRVRLRKNVTFADGHPFTADDVMFSFEAAYNEQSYLGDSLQVGGKRLEVAVVDPFTVDVVFPSPFGPGLRLLDNLPILPRHKLAAALHDKSFGAAWGLSTPPGQMTGLGPFVLSEYLPGQRLVFARNQRYFRTDANGKTLPYLDRVVLRIIPDQQTELLQLQGGAIDVPLTEVPLASYAVLKQDADAGRIQLFDVGAAYDPESLWFNLRPGAFAGDSRASWLQREELRQAISLGVDRRRFGDTVYMGAAVPVDGPITSANTKWFIAGRALPAYDLQRARSLLASIGLRDGNGDGTLEDASGAHARFTLLTQKGQQDLERGAAVIRDELRKLGLTVDVVPLDLDTVVQSFLSGKGYDAVYFHVGTSDTDPAINPDFWLSSGSSHVWNLRQGEGRSTAAGWEQQIDALMMRQMASADEAERKRLFAEVQTIFAEHVPVLYFAAPKVIVAASRRVTNVTPAISRPQLLWSIDTVAVKP